MIISVKNKFIYIFVLLLLINFSFISAQSVISEIDGGLSRNDEQTQILVNSEIAAKSIVSGDEVIIETISKGDENDPLYQEMLKKYELEGYNIIKNDENQKEDMNQNIQEVIDEIKNEIQSIEKSESDTDKLTNEETGFIPETAYENIPEEVNINEYENIKPEEIKKKITETKKVISKTKKKITPKSKEELEKELSFWQKFQKFMDSFSNKVGKTLAGNVIKDFKYRDIELPPIPFSPGDPQDITIPHKNFRFVGLTGNAIIGVPDWSYDGSKGGDFKWEASFTPKPKQGPIQHFDLKLESNMDIKNAVNGIVYNKGYYLNEKTNRWEEFSFTGTRIGNTHWLRERGDASITLNDVTDKDYNIFLAYSCLKLMEQEWRCNNGKWIVFVVETGNVSYNLNVTDFTMNYTEIKDLNISDLPSILKQLNVSAFDFQPTLYDALMVTPENNFKVKQNEIKKMNFIIKNLGNRDLSSLNFELDIGENSLAEVVEVDLPSNAKSGETVKGSVSLLFKENGNFRFNLYLMPHTEEVDTSDNMIRFNVTIGEQIKNNRTDSLNSSWNRNINYSIRESYSENRYGNGSNLVVISGTDLIRTVWGGYYRGKSINPTMSVDVKPLLTEEALFSNPYLASIFIGGKMLTGDREVVKYYVEIKNEKSGKIYTTPIMESMYKYYYNPRELIPDFELCTDYTSKIYLVGTYHETIDLIDPAPFNICKFEKYLNPFYARRILKLDGNYLLVTGGLDGKYFDEDQNVQYRIEFTDTKGSRKKYSTPVINAKDGFGLYKMESVFLNRYIDYNNGESIPGIAILTEDPKSRDGNALKYKPKDEKIHFVWKDWNINVELNLTLFLKDDKIKIFPSTSLSAFTNIFQGAKDYGLMKSRLDNYYRFEYPYYYSTEYQYETLFETKANLLIKDLNTGEIIYEATKDCEQFENPYRIFLNSERGSLDYNAIANYINTLDQDKKNHYNSCMYYGMSLSGFDLIKPVPKFVQGHYYDFIFKITSKNSDIYQNAPIQRILYLDSLQLLANNPILRTRFMNLENHPYFFKSYGSNSCQGDVNEYIPSFTYFYFPKNSKLNYETGQVEKQDINQREIKLNDLTTFKDSDSKDYFDFFRDENKIKPLFSSMTITVVPLKNDKQLNTNSNQFNCKLGRFDMVCYRSSSGYSITYVDSENNFIYKINLFDETSRFIKKYRDNPKIYDSVIYDILTEIERNPIQGFETPYTVSDFENNIKTMASIYQGDSSFRPYFIESSGAYLRNRTTLKTYINPDFNISYTYENLGDSLYNYNFNKNPITINVNVYDVSESKSIGSEDIIIDTSNFQEIVIKIFSKFNFKDYNNYQIFITNKDKNNGIFWLPVEFQYKKDYYDYIIKNFGTHLRKIPEFNSAILGPYQFKTRGETKICDYIFKDGKEYCYGEYYTYLSNGALSSNNPYFWRLAFKTDLGPDTSEIKRGKFMVLSSVNPIEEKNPYTNEFVNSEELRDNIFGERAKLLDSDRAYIFEIQKFDDIYNYYSRAPFNYNTLNTNIANISCTSDRTQNNNKATLTLICRWGNINDLKIYTLSIVQIFLNKSANDLYNLDNSTLADFKNNYAEKIITKHLEWYPSTELLNTNFDTYG